MSEREPPSGRIDLSAPVDLDALDAFLSSDRSPDDCMQLSELDGYLTGIAVGPEMIMPSEWLPHIWGEDGEAGFEDMEEAQDVLGHIMRRYNEIVQSLDAGPEAYVPVFWEDDEGQPDPIDWVDGFVRAMALRVDAWEPLARDEEAGVLLMPIMLISSLSDDGPNLGEDVLPEEEIEKLVAGSDEIIPGCVAGIRAYWREGGKPPPPRSRRRGKRVHH